MTLNKKVTPKIEIKNGENAEFRPIIVDGKIVDVVVVNRGREYFSSPELVVTSTEGGNGAVVRPVVDDGRVIDAIVTNTGIGYSSLTTEVRAFVRGSRGGFSARVRGLTLNNSNRFGDSICVGSGRVLVGAPFKSHFDTPSADGSAYCYNLHGGLLNNITAASYKERPQNINSYEGWGSRGPGIRTDSHFGHAVSINGHYAVISAPFHAEYIEYTGVPDSLFFYYTPQCLTVWDAIDSYNGRI